MRWLLLLAVLFFPSQGAAQVLITVDTSAARAVLAALADPGLTEAQARRVAALPGNRGLIRKALSYGRPMDEGTFARALIAAAHGDPAAVDPGKFGFAEVKQNAAYIEPVLRHFEIDRGPIVDRLHQRISSYASSDLIVSASGYLVVGGTANGFAFGGPDFFLNINRVSSNHLAETVLSHELYHVVQAAARDRMAFDARDRCEAKVNNGKSLSHFFTSLQAEGTAELVGDLSLVPGGDRVADEQIAHWNRNLSLVSRSVTLLELSVHGFATGANPGYDQIYALGFYGDEIMYPLGYRMAQAIERELGRPALARLIGQPGSEFIKTYSLLKAYGSNEITPALGAETVSWAKRLISCNLNDNHSANHPFVSSRSNINR